MLDFSLPLSRVLSSFYLAFHSVRDDVAVKSGELDRLFDQFRFLNIFHALFFQRTSSTNRSERSD
jgi:hypothetical protein